MHELVREELISRSNATTKELAQHLCGRINVGPVAIIAENPTATLSALRKQWLRLIRLAQKERSSTLDARKIVALLEQIRRMQTITFSADYVPELYPQPDVVIAAAEQFLAWAPECKTLYVLCDVKPDNEYGKAGDYQQVKMMSGVTSKIGRYHASVSADRILSQPKSTINFEEILDGKILICNLAKGLIGEDTSEVFGISILAKLQLASFQRIKKKRADRRPFFAYVDEFQNFATVSFTEMLSEARKYRLFLIMAEQTTAQQEDQRIVNKILTNAGTIICFKTNSPDDEDQALRLMNSQLQPGEIMNLPTYNFYIRLAGTEPQEPTSGKTLLPDSDGDEAIAERALELSRKNYATEYVAPVPKPKPKTKAESKKSAKSKQQAKKASAKPDETKPGRPQQLS